MIRLGVDAWNLASDRRGMGRLVRQTLQSLGRLDGSEIALVARTNAQARALGREFPYRTVAARELRAERFDAMWYPWNGMRFAPHAPSVVTIHDPFAFTFPRRDFIGRRREQVPIRRALARSDRIFAVSRWTSRALQEATGVHPARIDIVPNAPSPFWHPPTVLCEQAYMLFLGGCERRKNAELLFSAYDAAFASGGPTLVVAGALSQTDERVLQAMRAPHLRVHPSDEQLRELYRAARAVLVPSLAEGFGMPAIEAMACGAPVAAADAAALPETCAGAAMLVAARDERAWTAALRELDANAQLRKELRERGLGRVARMDADGPAKALLAFVRRSL